MESFANEGGLIPEQVWDSPDIAARELHLGRPSGSAMPLVWAHAEHLKLRRSLEDGRSFRSAAPNRPALPDRPHRVPASWSGGSTTRSDRYPLGKILRIETLAPAVVHWSADRWRTVEDATTHDTGLGIHTADLEIQKLSGGAAGRLHVPLARRRPLGRRQFCRPGRLGPERRAFIRGKGEAGEAREQDRRKAVRACGHRRLCAGWLAIWL